VGTEGTLGPLLVLDEGLEIYSAINCVCFDPVTEGFLDSSLFTIEVE